MFKSVYREGHFMAAAARSRQTAPLSMAHSTPAAHTAQGGSRAEFASGQQTDGWEGESKHRPVTKGEQRICAVGGGQREQTNGRAGGREQPQESRDTKGSTIEQQQQQIYPRDRCTLVAKTHVGHTAKAHVGTQLKRMWHTAWPPTRRRPSRKSSWWLSAAEKGHGKGRAAGLRSGE